MPKKYGVFLARMQPVHNSHLYIIKKALKENDAVLVLLGSANKKGNLRNPFDKIVRMEMLRECFTSKEKEKLTFDFLDDYSSEDDVKNFKKWGAYLYESITSRINQSNFNLYYSDDPKILDDWFKDSNYYDDITYKLIDRKNVFEGLSATKIRNALLNDDINYIKKYCPSSVIKRFDYLKEEYKKVVGDSNEGK